MISAAGQLNPYFWKLNLCDYLMALFLKKDDMKKISLAYSCSWARHMSPSITWCLTQSWRSLFAMQLFFSLKVLLWLGCVDAGSKTAHHNLKKGRSILIFIGGEREQLLTTPGEHTIFLSNRKGFIKLALEYGTPLVPMVSWVNPAAKEEFHQKKLVRRMHGRVVWLFSIV